MPLSFVSVLSDGAGVYFELTRNVLQFDLYRDLELCF